MKLMRTIAKNFKVLFRLKTALVAIIFGPLLVIFLIGFAFNSSSAIQLTVGYHAPDDSQLTNEFINTLEDKYTIKSFEIERDCIKELELGLVHTCIFFPENFVIEKDKQNEVRFVVDKSRINLAYSVIEGVSQQIGIKSEELSKGLAETLTKTLTDTSSIIDNSIGSLIKVKKDMGDSTTYTQEISNDLNNIDLDGVNVDLTGTDDLLRIKNKLDDIKVDVIDAIEEVENSNISQADIETVTNILYAAQESINSEHNSSVEIINELTTSISEAEMAISNIEDKVNTAKSSTEASKEKIANLKTKLEDINNEINSIKSDLEKISRDISSIEITSSDQIVNPINTKIETITADNNQLVSLLPYLLMLIIMFVGLMLSSTLVVVEKGSRASFRVFTTPTKDEFFILTTFVTSFIIVIVQLAVIALAIHYFLIDILTANLGLNILILILSTSIFIMLGMAIGYLINSQQGANMTSISIGALLLMLSNFVLPVESIIPNLRFIADYNPYVLASETLRKSTLFELKLNEMLTEISILLGFTVVIFILIIIFQRLAKQKYFKKNQHAKTKKIEEKRGLWIKNVLVHNEKEFIEETKNLTEEEFNKFIKRHSIKVRRFIKKELGKPLIAKLLLTYNKERFLSTFAKENQDILDEIKRKHEARLKERLNKKKQT